MCLFSWHKQQSPCYSNLPFINDSRVVKYTEIFLGPWRPLKIHSYLVIIIFVIVLSNESNVLVIWVVSRRLFLIQVNHLGLSLCDCRKLHILLPTSKLQWAQLMFSHVLDLKHLLHLHHLNLRWSLSLHHLNLLLLWSWERRRLYLLLHLWRLCLNRKKSMVITANGHGSGTKFSSRFFSSTILTLDLRINLLEEQDSHSQYIGDIIVLYTYFTSIQTIDKYRNQSNEFMSIF